MDSATSTIRQFLLEAQRRLDCRAVAFTSPSLDEFHFHSKAEDAPALDEMLRATAATFLEQCRTRVTRDGCEPLVRNRVRYESGGPLLGRFLAAPVPDPDGNLAGIVMSFRPMEWLEFSKIDARNAAQLSRELSQLLYMPADLITGSMGRGGMEKLVKWRLHWLEQPPNSSVLYVDIDQLHIVNDMHGLEAGDRAIAAVANALAAELANDDAVLSRLSGDRFTIFLPDTPLPQARQVASRLRHAVQAGSVVIGEEKIPLSISVGAAALASGERAFDHALAGAEVACKAAKERGRNRVEVYQISDASMIRRRHDMSMVGRLRHALEQRRYQIFGQPIASLLQPDSVHRYEMLLRILDEEGRLVLPANFMSSATRYQLLPQMDRCVVMDVLAHLRTARARPGFKPLHLCVNLSGPTISDDAFLDWMLMQLDESGVSADWLTFELTETAAVSNMEQAQLLMSKLGALGCRFALDDFGTGLSSLTHLKNLPFSSLKIDGSFIRDILHDERSQALVRAVAQLAGAMGMETVAEYVETPEVCMRLIELQVQFGQGYAIGKPRPLTGILSPTAALLHAS